MRPAALLEILPMLATSSAAARPAVLPLFATAPAPDKVSGLFHAAEVAPVWWTVCRLTVYVLVMAACMSAS